MKVISICHPFKGDIKGNQERVRLICEAIKNEFVPLAPHLLLPNYIEEDTERELALVHGLVLLRTCDELWIASENITEGMQEEIEEAKRRGIPVLKVDPVELVNSRVAI